MNEKEKHLYHYLILVVALFISFSFFLFLKNDYVARLIVAIIFCVFYSFWGIMHHALEGRLTKVVVLEYILLSAFVLILLMAYIV
jgi:hypothetical protein